MVLAALLGVTAGAVTTLAGMGGGMVLVLGLALIWDPATALAATGPALLLGNIHRLWMYRDQLDVARAARYALGGAPGALIGGMALGVVPLLWIELAMLTIAGAAAAKVLLGWAWTPPAGALIPGGFAVGFTASTAGGGGLIAGPMLLASGLSGRGYVATAAMGAAAVHIARMAGYGVSGILDGPLLANGAALAVLVVVGNALGDRVRRVLGEDDVARLEWWVVVVCLLLATANLVT